MHASPPVSVVMAVCNGARYLGEAVASVCSQTLADFEVVAVDDGSTDETTEILEEWRRSDARVRVLRNDANLRLIRSLNRGLEEARGELVARMDADDVCMPQRLEKQVAYLDGHPECVLVGSRVLSIDEDFVPVVTHQDFEMDLGALSGGERTAAAFAYRLALNGLVRSHATPGQRNMLMLDEPTDGFSREQVVRMGGVLRDLDADQVVIVSHDRELRAFANHVYVVHKAGGASQVAPVG